MKSVTIPKKEKLWGYIVKEGRKIEKEYIANKFDKGDIHTILATMDYFCCSDIWIRQSHYDLTLPKYRLFDWLAMGVMGRNDDDRKLNNTGLKVLVYAWLKVKGDPVKFIADLRETDYDVDRKWEKVEIEED